MNKNDKIALCFLVTKNIININLWKKWWKGYEDYFTIYSHYSKKGDIVQSKLVNNRVDPVPTRWGHISLVHAEKQLYKKAFSNKSNKMFILISDSCVPVKPFKTVYQKLMKDKKRGIVPYRSIGRYSHDDMAPFRSRPKCIDVMEKYKLFSKDLYACDQWKCLSRPNVSDFLGMYRNKTFMKLFDYTCIDIIPDSLAPDELMYINWLQIKHGFGSKNLNKVVRNGLITYVDFNSKAIHPLNYRQVTPKLKENICYSTAIFARKFVNPMEKKLLTQLPTTCREKTKSKKRKSNKKSTKTSKKSRKRSAKQRKRKSSAKRSRKSKSWKNTGIGSLEYRSELRKERHNKNL